MKIKKLGIIAGSGTMPQEAVHEAMARKLDFEIFPLKEETVEPLKDLRGNLLKSKVISLGQFDKVLRELVKSGVSHVLFAGKIHKEKILKGIRFNLKTLALLKKLIDYNDKSIYNLVASEFEKEGINVIRQDKFYRSLVVAPGVYSKKKPDKQDIENIMFGMSYAKKIAALDIGQCVIVAGKFLIAVEAVEGTDETIRRSGKYLKKRNGIVCKAMRKNQDTRFDVASVGLSTFESMKASGCSILAIEANRTFVFDKDEFIRQIDKNKMILVVV